MKMSKVITKYELQKQLHTVNKYSKTITGVSSPVAVASSESVNFVEKNIVKIRSNNVITEDGLEYPLFSPLPCVYWKCLTPADKNGVSTLKTKILGLFIINEEKDKGYCIGISGYSDEFELRLQVGSNEIRFNNTFLNIVTNHLVKNGLEEK